MPRIDVFKAGIFCCRACIDVTLQHFSLLLDAKRIADHVPHWIENDLPSRIAIIGDSSSHGIDRRCRIVFLCNRRDGLPPKRVAVPKERFIISCILPMTRPHLPQPPHLALSRFRHRPRSRLQLVRHSPQFGQ